MRRNRYPGVNPFETEEKDRFFGRSTDIADLCDLIALEKLVVLFGKSGYGKSSLINAGIIPALQTNSHFSDALVPIRIRIGSYTGIERSPLESVQYRLNESVPLSADTRFLDDIVKKRDLWYHFKRRQQAGSPKKYLLIFDQFEEFFTFPLEDQTTFKNELSELLYQGQPQTIRNLSESLSREQRLLLSTEVDVHVLFVIREDRLSLLDNLRDRLPSILHKRYQLRALTSEQAREAIIMPAQLDGADFSSPKFSFTEEALEKIIGELSQTGPSQKTSIEAFQLQIVCQHVESDVAAGKVADYTYDGMPDIRPENLPDLSNIYEAYYNHQIGLLPAAMQEPAQKLIEEGLLFEDPLSGEGRRLSLDKDLLIRQYDLTGEREHLLTQLENTFLIRREANTLGGFNYELSHDTLIAPILQVRRERREIELVRELKKTRKASRVRRLVRLSMALLALFVVLVYNWEFLSAYAITFIQGQNHPLVKNSQKLYDYVDSLSTQLDREMRLQSQGGKFVLGSWTSSQILTALNGKVHDLPKDSILLLYKNQVLESCCCWSEIDNSMHDIRASSWVIGGLYRIGWGQDIQCDMPRFLLSNQLKNGAWSMVGVDSTFSSNESSINKFSSTYATCQALLGLNAIRNSTSNNSVEIQNAIDKGITWLKANQEHVRWKDYPNNNEEAVITSKSISGLALHTLNALGVASPEMNQMWLESLDYSDLDNPMTSKEQSDVYYRYLKGDQLTVMHHDATRHFVLPWLIIATVDAYPDGTLEQKARANLWFSKAIGKMDMEELTKAFPFTKAELLISFRYLAENKIEL